MAKKKVQDQGAQIPRNAAYLAVREIPRDAAQHRYWTFYEAINSLFLLYLEGDIQEMVDLSANFR